MIPISSSCISYAFKEGFRLSLFNEKETLVKQTVLRCLKNSNIETRKNRKRKRTYYAYSSNITISRSSEYPHKPGIRPSDSEFKQWRNVVIDHAYRRMQIFYYQLLFYFQEHCSVMQEKTLSQHGKSSCCCCSAAHSAILPNLKDEKRLMSQKLHLYHTMNSTIEMPAIVNAVDCVIENQIRSTALDLIHLTSLNNLHPYAALTLFAEKLAEFFALGKKETELRLSLLDKIEHLEEKIHCLETKEPAVPVDWVRNYARLVYDLQKCRKAFLENKNYTLPISLEKYDLSRRNIFSCICGSCQNEEKLLNSIKTHQQLKKYLSKREGFPSPLDKKLSKKKKVVRKFIASMHPVDLWLIPEKKALLLYQKVSRLLPLTKPISKTAISDARTQLNDSKRILELQEKGSVCPPFKYLSGHQTDGRRLAYTIEQLLEQKKMLQTSD